MSLLQVKNLSVSFGGIRAIDNVSFQIDAGETLGLVGESGCGKSVSSLALLGLIGDPGRIDTGEIIFDGANLLQKNNRQMRDIRGRDIAMIFQEPMTSLNPVYTIGDQIMEAVLCHEPVSIDTAWSRGIEGLKEVGIADPEGCMNRYPHELSGGMKQRAMIAMALICRPKLLIADEPTTALDVTVQAQILDLLRNLQASHNMAMLFITHDLGVIAELAHRACVMYAGKVVETSATEVLLHQPLHPYTQGLLASIPRLEGERKKLSAIPGFVPPPSAYPSGCRFHPRCRKASEVCRTTCPVLEEKKATATSLQKEQSKTSGATPLASPHRCACHHAGSALQATKKGTA